MTHALCHICLIDLLVSWWLRHIWDSMQKLSSDVRMTTSIWSHMPLNHLPLPCNTSGSVIWGSSLGNVCTLSWITLDQKVISLLNLSWSRKWCRICLYIFMNHFWPKGHSAFKAFMEQRSLNYLSDLANISGTAERLILVWSTCKMQNVKSEMPISSLVYGLEL